MKYDLSEVAALLHVHEKATGHPRLKPLADAAMAQLEKYADEHRPKPEVMAVEEPASGDGEPGVDATMTTSNGRRL